MVASRRPAQESIYQLKVTLKDIRPPIWRRIQVPGGTTLYKLHQILQIVMGWENYHLYEFEIGRDRHGEPDREWGLETKSARRSRLGQVVQTEKAKFHYVYDMGDNWEHEILVEKILPPEPGKRYPACVTGKRACPPEDCGGVWGYAELLEIMRDPEHEEYEERMEWLGGEFDPETFDVDRANEFLRKIR